MAGKINYKAPPADVIMTSLHESLVLRDARYESRKNANKIDEKKLIANISRACQRLEHDLNRPGVPDVGYEIGSLVSILNRAIEIPNKKSVEMARRRIKMLDKDCMRWIEDLASRRSREVPQEKCETETAEYLFRWRSLLTYGGKMEEGRKRPNGSRSKPVMKWNVVAPETPKKGRPKHEAARHFIMILRLAFIESGYTPPLVTHHSSPANFAGLVASLTKGAGFSAGEIINAWGALHRAAALDHERRRLLVILSSIYPAHSREISA